MTCRSKFSVVPPPAHGTWTDHAPNPLVRNNSSLPKLESSEDFVHNIEQYGEECFATVEHAKRCLSYTRMLTNTQIII